MPGLFPDVLLGTAMAGSSVPRMVAFRLLFRLLKHLTRLAILDTMQPLSVLSNPRLPSAHERSLPLSAIPLTAVSIVGPLLLPFDKLSDTPPLLMSRALAPLPVSSEHALPMIARDRRRNMLLMISVVMTTTVSMTTSGPPDPPRVIGVMGVTGILGMFGRRHRLHRRELIGRRGHARV